MGGVGHRRRSQSGTDEPNSYKWGHGYTVTPRKPGEGRAAGRRTRRDNGRESGPGAGRGRRDSETTATATARETGDRRGARGSWGSLVLLKSNN